MTDLTLTVADGAQTGAGDTVLAPDGQAWLTAPWVGGSLDGPCGATRWVEDEDGTIQQAEQFLGALTGAVRPWQASTTNPLVMMSQMRWFSGGFPEGRPGGFRVECRLGRDHDEGHDFPQPHSSVAA